MANKAPKESARSIYDSRVDVVVEMLLSGLRRRQILQNIAKKEKLQWDVTPSQVDNYIARAKEKIKESLEPNKEKLSEDIQGRYNFLYQRLIAVKDYRGAVAPLDKLSELAGIKVLKIGGDPGNPLPVTFQFIPYDGKD